MILRKSDDTYFTEVFGYNIYYYIYIYKHFNQGTTVRVSSRNFTLGRKLTDKPKILQFILGLKGPKINCITYIVLKLFGPPTVLVLIIP